MVETQKRIVYYIFLDGGDDLFVLGRTGVYESTLSKAMVFEDKLSAILCVERLGYEKIAYIRGRVI